MFGAIWAFISAGAIIKDKIRRSIRNSKSKDKARHDQFIGKNPFGTYYDDRGRMRLLENDQIVSARPDPWTHEWYIEDIHGKKLRNLTKEHKQQKLKYVQNHYDKFHTVVCIKEKRNENIIKCEFDEPIYKDVLNGRRYVVRRFESKWDDKIKEYKVNHYFKKLLKEETANELGDLSFYMDCETGLLIRLTDSYLRRTEERRVRAERKKNNEVEQKVWAKLQKDMEIADIFIEAFNEYQNDRVKEMDLKQDWSDFLQYYGGDSFGYDTETDRKEGY